MIDSMQGLTLNRLLPRAVGLFVMWLLLAGGKPLDIAVGALTAIVAAVVSVRLLPQRIVWLHPVSLLRYVLHFLRQSVAAGVDVAWRALDPRLPLRPGFIKYRPRHMVGGLQEVFCIVTSLLPGTLPCGSEQEQVLVIHCLDVSQPVTEQLAAEEVMLWRAFGDTRHG